MIKLAKTDLIKKTNKKSVSVAIEMPSSMVHGNGTEVEFLNYTKYTVSKTIK